MLMYVIRKSNQSACRQFKHSEDEGKSKK